MYFSFTRHWFLISKSLTAFFSALCIVLVSFLLSILEDKVYWTNWCSTSIIFLVLLTIFSNPHLLLWLPGEDPWIEKCLDVVATLQAKISTTEVHYLFIYFLGYYELQFELVVIECFIFKKSRTSEFSSSCFLVVDTWDGCLFVILQFNLLFIL